MTRADTSDNAAATLSETSVRARRAARVAAVQALYQRDMNDISARSVIAEFGSYRLDETVDAELFGQLVAGVDENLTEIDGRISGALVEGWSLDRLETVLARDLPRRCLGTGLSLGYPLSRDDQPICRDRACVFRRPRTGDGERPARSGGA
jgi:hypothetical protein